jgi:hypothetical protein
VAAQDYAGFGQPLITRKTVVSIGGHLFSDNARIVEAKLYAFVRLFVNAIANPVLEYGHVMLAQPLIDESLCRNQQLHVGVHPQRVFRINILMNQDLVDSGIPAVRQEELARLAQLPRN